MVDLLRIFRRFDVTLIYNGVPYNLKRGDIRDLSTGRGTIIANRGEHANQLQTYGQFPRIRLHLDGTGLFINGTHLEDLTQRINEEILQGKR